MDQSITLSNGTVFNILNVEHDENKLDFDVQFDDFNKVSDIIAELKNNTIISCVLSDIDNVKCTDIVVTNVVIKNLMKKLLRVSCIHTHKKTDEELDIEIKELEEEVARLQKLVEEKQR